MGQSLGSSFNSYLVFLHKIGVIGLSYGLIGIVNSSFDLYRIILGESTCPASTNFYMTLISCLYEEKETLAPTINWIS